jgi:hypothetical protein
MHPIRSIRDALTYSWPIIARAAGVTIGAVELILWAILGRSPSSELTTLAGTLITVSVVAPEKPKRKRDRE